MDMTVYNFKKNDKCVPYFILSLTGNNLIKRTIGDMPRHGQRNENNQPQ